MMKIYANDVFKKDMLDKLNKAESPEEAKEIYLGFVKSYNDALKRRKELENEMRINEQEITTYKKYVDEMPTAIVEYFIK